MGIVAGLAMAVLTSLAVVIMYLVRGPGTFERLGVSLGSTIGLYLAAGVVGGAVVGFLLPLTVWRWGAVFVGMVAAVPLYWGVGLLLGESDFYAVLIPAVFIGGGVGYGLWSPVDERMAQNTNSEVGES